MHRHDGLDAEQLDGLGRPLRTHRVPAADGQEGDVEAAELRDQRHVAENVGVAGEVDGESVLELDHEPARVTAVDDRAVLGDAARVLGVDQRDLDAVHLDGSALVGAHDLVRVEAFRAEPDADLVVADDGGLGAARDLERVVDVVEVAVRDQHQVARVDGLQRLRRCRIAHDPGVDENLFALGALCLPGPVTDPGEADVTVQRHHYPPLHPAGKGDFPTRPARRSRSPRGSRCWGRRDRMAAG